MPVPKDSLASRFECTLFVFFVKRPSAPLDLILHNSFLV